MLHRLFALPFLRLLPVVTLLLSGCATTVTTQVTSFHELSDGLQGKRFVITPSIEQQNSLEFNSYAGLVRQALVGKGLVDAGEARGAAELGVAMTYSVAGLSSGFRGGTGTYAGFGAGSGFSMGGVGIGIGFPLGGGGRDSTAYVHSLRVEIDRLTASGERAAAAPPPGTAFTPGTAGSARVYEARAISEGSSASPAPVMRAMVRAIFEEFPGESGRTRVVQLPLDDAPPAP